MMDSNLKFPNTAPDIRNKVLKVLKESSKQSDHFEEGILSFDEMHTSKEYAYNSTTQTVHGPNKKLQAVIMRGLFRP